MNPTGNDEVVDSIRGLTEWVKDLVLLWLWCRPAAGGGVGRMVLNGSIVDLKYLISLRVQQSESVIYIFTLSCRWALGLFHILAAINIAAMNTEVHFSAN